MVPSARAIAHLLEKLQHSLLVLDECFPLIWGKVDVIAAQLPARQASRRLVCGLLRQTCFVRCHSGTIELTWPWASANL